MTILDVLKINAQLLSMLNSNGIEIKDVNYIGMYDEYQQMKDKGLKVNYIVADLSERYDIGERTVWRVIKKLSGEFAIFVE